MCSTEVVEIVTSDREVLPALLVATRLSGGTLLTEPHLLLVLCVLPFVFRLTHSVWHVADSRRPSCLALFGTGHMVTVKACRRVRVGTSLVRIRDAFDYGTVLYGVHAVHLLGLARVAGQSAGTAASEVNRLAQALHRPCLTYRVGHCAEFVVSSCIALSFAASK